MTKWIVRSQRDVRVYQASIEIEADTEEQAYQYYLDNIWGTDKDYVNEQVGIDDSDEVTEILPVEKGGA